MIIGIDYRLANNSTRGMARYCREITRCMLESNTQHCYILYVDKELSHSIKQTPNILVKRIKTNNFILGEQICLALQSVKDKLDVLWSPYNTFPLFLRRKTKLAVTIHDLIFWDYLPGKSSIVQKIGRFYRKYCLLFGKNKITYCFTVSNYSKNEIKRKLAIQNVIVTPNCVDRTFCDEVASYHQKLLFTSTQSVPPFYFTLSGDAPSKNLLFVINYFKKFLPTTDLYIAGVPDNSYLRSYGSEHIIVLKNNLQDKEIIDYYSRCKAFLFLSLQEGFGRPVIEALYCNAKVIASNRTSIPEIAGNCVLLIDPQDEKQLTLAIKNIETFLVDATLKKKHLEKYLHWEVVAQIICEYLLKN
jgi:glycosyltransferase involved in cell wall biosynthesis